MVYIFLVHLGGGGGTVQVVLELFGNHKNYDFLAAKFLSGLEDECHLSLYLPV